MGKVLLPVPNLGSVVDSASGNLPQVLMMQTANQRHLDHLPTVWPLHRPWDWTVMIERSMRANFMVIGKATLKNMAQVSFVEDEHSIQAFPPDGSDQPLHVGLCQGGLGQIMLGTEPAQQVAQEC
jgi:hypothetical protein